MSQESHSNNGAHQAFRTDTFGPMGTSCQASEDPVAPIFKMKRSRREIASLSSDFDQFSEGEIHELEKHNPDNFDGEVAFSGDDLIKLFQAEAHEVKIVDTEVVNPTENQEEHDNSDSDSSGSDFDGDNASDDGERFFRLPSDDAEYCKEKREDFEDIPKENRQPEQKPNPPRGEAISEIFKGPRDEKEDDVRIPLFSDSVRHPWCIVDYHLYLLQIESTMNQKTRRNNVWLRDGVECRPLCYEEFFEEETFDPALVGTEPSLLFAALPVADNGVHFHGSTYVLKYDWNTKVLSARFFNSLPEDMRNIEWAWKESVIVYSLPIMEIVDIMKYCMAQRYRRIEFLSTNCRCITPYVVNDDPGMELIMAYRFCQFAVDFAEAIFAHMSTEDCDALKSELIDVMEEIRLTLQRASYRAWFAVREGLSMERFSHRVSFDRYLNDLFTYNKSNQEGSLRGKNWSAFGMDTCNRIRDEETQKRRAINEQLLQEVFAPLDEEQTQEQVFEDMLANVNEAQADNFLHTEINTPPILPPSLDEVNSDEVDLDEYDLDDLDDIVFETPVLPNIVQPVATEADICGVTEYHDVPLEHLFNHASALIRSQPELDTLENCGRLGALLTELGLGLNKIPLNELESLPERELHNDNLSLQVNDTSDSISSPQA